MSVTRSLASLTCACAVALGASLTPARAVETTTDVGVSRVTLKLPGGGWIVSDAIPYSMPVSSSGVTVGGERRLVIIGTPGTRSELVMFVSATRGQRNITLHDDCDPEDGHYIRKFNRGQSTAIPLQCLWLGRQGRLPAVDDLNEPMRDAMKAQHVVGPPEGSFAWVRVSNENGAVVDITALIGSDVVGLQDRHPVARLPQGVRESVAAWADTLAENALGTLSSWGGRLAVPPVAFNQAGAAAPAFAASSAIKD